MVLNTAHTAIRSGNGLKEAIDLMNLAIMQFPEDGVLFYLLGGLLKRANQMEEGLRAVAESQRLFLHDQSFKDKLTFQAKIQEYSRFRQCYNPPYSQFFSYAALQEHTDAFDKKRAFKDSVDYIDFETSSMCNRVCNYCPNSLVDRRSHNIVIGNDVFAKVITELAEIDYNRIISLSGHNEPLADRDILTKIAIVRNTLRVVQIIVYSNGDYLTRPYLEELRAAGLNNLEMSIHMQPGEAYSTDACVDRVLKMAARLNIDNPQISPYASGVMAVLPFEGMSVRMFQNDYETNGYDWAGLVKRDMPIRTAPCSHPIRTFTIRYNGNVMPCCLFVGDHQDLENFVCGNVKEQSIFDIYSGEKLVKMRRHVFAVGDKLPPCNTCAKDPHPLGISPLLAG